MGHTDRAWVQDCYDSYEDAPTDGTVVPDNAGCSRVARGGSWYLLPWLLRSAYRGRNEPDLRFLDQGFRVGRVLPSPRTL